MNTALTNLYISLICVNEDRERSFHIIKTIVLCSIPKLRVNIIKAILNNKDGKPTFNYILNKIGGISHGKVRRTIEDMIITKDVKS